MAEAWRTAGGTLNVTHLALGWGPLGLSATAKLSFDDHLHPVGTADLHVIGYAKTLEALARQRVITKDTALAATAVLTLLSHTPRDGGAPEVEVPLTLRDRTLLMGKTPLVRVPELSLAAAMTPATGWPSWTARSGLARRALPQRRPHQCMSRPAHRPPGDCGRTRDGSPCPRQYSPPAHEDRDAKRRG